MLNQIIKKIYHFIYRFKYPKIFTQGKNTISIGGNINIESPSLLSIGKGIHLGNQLLVMNRGLLTIGNNVIFAPNITIIDYNHDYKSKNFIPYSHHDIIKPVTIADNVWLGFGVILLPGTHISTGAIISAGSVVRGNVPPNSIYSGNPAINVGTRETHANQKPYMYNKLGLDN
jgi:acetyltransferase-like isoleucine patch superfamily enzyme